MQICFTNPQISSVFSKLLAPYEEAANHFTYTVNGKVDNAAQRIFSKDKSSTTLSLKERALHILTGLSLALPLVNFISYFVLSKLDCLISKLKTPTPDDIPEGRARFGGVRARVFDKDAPADHVAAITSIELPLRRTPGAA